MIYSPHLDVVRKLGFDVLILTEPVDSFMLMQFHKYKEHTLTNVAAANLELPAESSEGEEPAAPENQHTALLENFESLSWETASMRCA